MKKNTRTTKKKIDDNEAFQSYCELLERTIRDIDSISQEFDAAFLNNISVKIPQDIRFDAVPIMRKLKNAQKDAKQSFSHFSKRL